MAEFTVHIDTFPGSACSEERLDQIADRLEATEALDPVVSLETETGVVGATFQVEAATIDSAGAIGVRSFQSALRDAGIVGSSGTYHVRPVEEVDTFSVARVSDDDREESFA